MPAKIRNNDKADYSRRVFIDFNLPAPHDLKSSSMNKEENNEVKQPMSKELTPASFPNSEEKHKIKSEQKEELPLPENALNTKQPDIPVNFFMNEKNKNEIFGIQNIAFSANGHTGILSPSGNGKGEGVSGFGNGNGAGTKGSGFSDKGEGAGNYYTNYYKLCLKKIEEQKNYPDIALIRQIEGAVDVKIVLTPDGNVADIRIIESSGWNMLDEEAIRCVRRASPFPSPHEEFLADSKLTLSFTIVFELS